jgi:methionyl aminopeptidase
MRIYFKTADEIRKMREVNLVVSAVLDACCAAVRPGVSTLELDEIAMREIARHKVTSSFIGYGYPPYRHALCTSVRC